MRRRIAIIALMCIWGMAIFYLRGDHYYWFNIQHRWLKLILFGLPLVGLFLYYSEFTRANISLALMLWLGLLWAFSMGHSHGSGQPWPQWTLELWFIQVSRLFNSGLWLGIAPAIVGKLSGRYSCIWALSIASLSMPLAYTFGWWIRYDDLYPGNPLALRPWSNEISDILNGLFYYGPMSTLMLFGLLKTRAASATIEH